MKLKYYLRGMGVGVLLTAIIMGVALSGSSSKISDEEVIRRAKQLGMVEAEDTLSQYSESARLTEEIAESDSTSSDTELDTQGEEISEEINQGESETGESVPEVVEEEKESSNLGESSESVEAEPDIALAGDDAAGATSTETVESSSSASKSVEVEVAENESPKTENEETDTTVKEEVDDSASSNSSSEASTTEEAPAETESTAPQTNEAVETAEAQPASSDVNYVVVVIPGGSESDTCARIIREAGIIDDGVAFNNYLVNAGLDRKIRSGTKQIPKGASFEEIARIITK
ncbi:hypothetical protein [Butyrivibrio sp. AE3006]|uniref:hypothetical protein n=1 Tax=Butyrivibrio sp. AE3006 TaxID=1280673 RepID=UPI0004249926|nr:hypothetical protein [Butyrivibrio sp. AE3006]